MALIKVRTDIPINEQPEVVKSLKSVAKKIVKAIKEHKKLKSKKDDFSN